jgi:hypothetical protein
MAAPSFPRVPAPELRLWVSEQRRACTDRLVAGSLRMATLGAEAEALDTERRRLEAAIAELYRVWQPRYVQAAITRGDTSLLPKP